MLCFIPIHEVFWHFSRGESCLGSQVNITRILKPRLKTLPLLPFIGFICCIHLRIRLSKYFTPGCISFHLPKKDRKERWNKKNWEAHGGAKVLQHQKLSRSLSTSVAFYSIFKKKKITINIRYRKQGQRLYFSQMLYSNVAKFKQGSFIPSSQPLQSLLGKILFPIF